MIDILHGCNNALAEKHIPEIPPRQDTLGGPSGRRADMVRVSMLFTVPHALFCTQGGAC